MQFQNAPNWLTFSRACLSALLSMPIGYKYLRLIDRICVPGFPNMGTVQVMESSSLVFAAGAPRIRTPRQANVITRNSSVDIFLRGRACACVYVFCFIKK